MSRTDAAYLANQLRAKGINARPIGIRYVGSGYQLITWSVEVPKKDLIPGVPS